MMVSLWNLYILRWIAMKYKDILNEMIHNTERFLKYIRGNGGIYLSWFVVPFASLGYDSIN